MEAHQRRIFTQMLDQLDLYNAGSVTLDRAVKDLAGLLDAAEIHDNNAIRAFRNHLAPINRQIELQDWPSHAPTSWAELDAAIDRFRTWVHTLLADPSEEPL